jgi:hypothetical protein
VDGTYRPGIAGVHESYRLSPDGTKVFMWWMRARDLPQCEAAMQKVCYQVFPHITLVLTATLVHLGLYVGFELVSHLEACDMMVFQGN